MHDMHACLPLGRLTTTIIGLEMTMVALRTITFISVCTVDMVIYPSPGLAFFVGLVMHELEHPRTYH
jgi:hypothetical protein